MRSRMSFTSGADPRLFDFLQSKLTLSIVYYPKDTLFPTEQQFEMEIS